MAGLHYAWNVGELKAYEPTFLYHKIETIQSVNRWLRYPNANVFTACVRQIATLCFAECCLGNVATAETHLDGLMTIMDHQPSNPHSSDGAVRVEEELADRYLILTYTFVHGIKSRLQDMPIGAIDLSEGKTHPSEIRSLMKKWHKEERGGLKNRLTAMRMFPYFFNPLPHTTEFRDIDVTPIIACLKILSDMVEIRRLNPYLPYGECSRDLIWLEGGATRLLLVVVHAHVESISPHTPEPSQEYGARDKLRSSWSGMSASNALYLHSILGLWNAGEPIEDRLHSHVLSILQRDLEQNHFKVSSRQTKASDLWFWKAFVGAFSITKRQKVDTGVVRGRQPTFNNFICDWSKAMAITRWADARARLKRVLWPASFWEDDTVQQMWDAASKDR
ncbi:Fc.00g104260.m01.CDS01 [Cosmosporella sp. VM-42]